MSELCWLLHSRGSFFSLENPRSSYAWDYAPIAALLEIGHDVDFDQCMYDLLPPHMTKEGGAFIKKATRVRTNLESLKGLAVKCDKSHPHFTCLGQVKVKGRNVRVSTYAGRYPNKLCDRWAQLVANSVSDPPRLRAQKARPLHQVEGGRAADPLQPL